MLKEDFKKLILNKKNVCLNVKVDSFKSRKKLLEKTAFAIKSGINILQFDSSNIPDKEAFEIGKTLQQLCSVYDAFFVVNSRVDLALALNAQGVYLNENDIDIRIARKLLGKDKFIGSSVKKPTEALNAYKKGADYLGVYLDLDNKKEKYSGLKFVKWVAKTLPVTFYVYNNINFNNVKVFSTVGINKIILDDSFLKTSQIDDKINKYKGILNGNY